MIGRFLTLVTLFLAACSAPQRVELPDRAAGSEAILAPFEDHASIPPQISQLPFDATRAYAILVQIPAPAVVDLSRPDRARRGLTQFLNPLATVRAGTLMGHTMAGWRCADGTLGLASKTGDDGNAGLRMVLRGWGLSAFLSEYHDGHLYEAAQINPRHRRVLRQGRARIVAVEIDEADCQRIRRALVRYRTHPNRPERVFTMLRDPADLRGDGCAEFALWLVGQGDVFRPLVPGMRRRIALSDRFVGRGAPVDGPVIPYALEGVDTPVPLVALLTADWASGESVGTITVLDLELLRLTLDRAYARTGPVEPRLRTDDAQANRLRDAADRWLGRYRVARPVRVGRARAVMLQRR